MNPFTATIDCATFLARLDPIWDPLVHRGGRYFDKPAATRCDWGEAALLGNGMMGAAIYKKEAVGLCFELGRNDVEAHQFLEGVDWCVPRIPIGDLVLSTTAGVHSETMRLSLHDAEARGRMETDGGAIAWRAFSDAARDVLVLVVTEEGAAEHTLSLVPAHGVSPRLAWVAAEKAAAVAGVLPPKPTMNTQDGITLALQLLTNNEGVVDGECATALARAPGESGSIIYFLSIQHSREAGVAREAAIEAVKMAMKYGLSTLEVEHRAWWHAFYTRSFLSIPDTRWEAFYYIQMYKLGSTTRGNHTEVIDNQGIWLTDSAWPGTWWNLNVQLSYSPMAKANRLDLARSLPNALQLHEAAVRANAAPVAKDGMYLGRTSGRLLSGGALPTREEVLEGKLALFELGNFTWTAKLLYDQYRYSMDRVFLSSVAFPILKAAVSVMLKLLTRWEDGKLHLPKTTSPEYPDPKDPTRGTSCPAYDTSYDLALLRWGLGALLTSCETLGMRDPMEETWRETLRDLAPYNIDENGFMVARDLPFAVSHRHYSHLFALYPLGLLNLEDPQERALAEKSLRHWIGLRGALSGYSYTGAAAMAALLGDGNLALDLLNGLREFLLPGTMYVESGGPVIETPLSGAESLQCFFLLSDRGSVRVFPAVPDAFGDVAFAGLLAEGAFEVSALRRGGVNRWVHVTSLAGESLRIFPNLPGPVRAHGERAFTVTPDGEGACRVDLRKGESVLLYSGEAIPKPEIAPVASEKTFENHYGSLKEGMGAKAFSAVTRIQG